MKEHFNIKTNFHFPYSLLNKLLWCSDRNDCNFWHAQCMNIVAHREWYKYHWQQFISSVFYIKVRPRENKAHWVNPLPIFMGNWIFNLLLSIYWMYSIQLLQFLPVEFFSFVLAVEEEGHKWHPTRFISKHHRQHFIPSVVYIRIRTRFSRAHWLNPLPNIFLWLDISLLWVTGYSEAFLVFIVFQSGTKAHWVNL